MPWQKQKLGQGVLGSPTTPPTALQPTNMAIQLNMPPSRRPKWDQVTILVTKWTKGWAQGAVHATA